MFTGIVQEVGHLTQVHSTGAGQRLRISAKTITKELQLGESISVSGVCLTACQVGNNFFEAQASAETLRHTKLGLLQPGQSLNLERALALRDRLGGHFVCGHVDALGHVRSIVQEGFSKLIEFSAPQDLAPFFVEKGSVAIDGVSLTISSLNSSLAEENIFSFTVALIPHTLCQTTLEELACGNPVNIEADLIGKYVARLMLHHNENVKKAGLSLSFLSEHGYT